MPSKIRYQAAILQNDHLLLLKVNDRDSGQTFWVIPGGGREPNETEEACVQREVLEETHLHVKVKRLLFENTPDTTDTHDEHNKTYLCKIISGEARPGIEPEVDDKDHTTIKEVGWFDLRDPTTWDTLAIGDPFTYPKLQQLRSTLGYTS